MVLTDNKTDSCPCHSDGELKNRPPACIDQACDAAESGARPSSPKLHGQTVDHLSCVSKRALLSTEKFQSWPPSGRLIYPELKLEGLKAMCTLSLGCISGCVLRAVPPQNEVRDCFSCRVLAICQAFAAHAHTRSYSSRERRLLKSKATRLRSVLFKHRQVLHTPQPPEEH